MGKKRDELERMFAEREPEAATPIAPEMDAVESRWDPWLRALARAEWESEARVN